MKIEKGKVIINKKDLNKKVILIRNSNSDEELQAAQFSAMQAVKESLAIPESSFERYNRFRYHNKHKKLTLDQVMIVDIRKSEEKENFENFRKQNNEKEI